MSKTSTTGSQQPPVAIIDSQDELFSQPLREFLESWGCAVMVNEPGAGSALYHIVCGDNDFVKRIVSDAGGSHSKIIAIIWNGSYKKLPIPELVHVRQVIVDPELLTKETVHAIFQFYFTSRARTIDLRLHQQPIAFPIEEQHDSQKKSSHDKDRINELVHEMFEEKDDFKKLKKARPAISRWVNGIIAILVAVILSYGLILATGLGALSLGTLLLKQSNVAGATEMGKMARLFGAIGVRELSIIGSPLVWLGITGPVRSQERLVSLIQTSGGALVHVGELLQTSQELGAALFSSEPSQERPARRVERLQASLFQTRTDVGLVQANLGVIGQTMPLRSLSQMVHALVGTIGSYRHMVETIETLAVLYKDMGGFDTPQTYLLLFQNSSELRPTGGFIGSIGTMTVADGSIGELAVHDVYELDGQLKGHVDPPFAIRGLLGEEHWYLRDSNWDPDFVKSGERAAWFYEKESGSPVDGVIGISTPFMVDMLEATGPLELPDFNDRISADNFLGKLLYYTKTDFFPGSTQKKDFLGSLMRALISRLTSGDRLNTTRLVGAIVRALGSRDLVFYFPDAGRSILTKQAGWDGGRIGADPCEIEKPSGFACLGLPVGIVDANVGVNKVNMFITNALTRNISTEGSDEIVDTVTLSQSNTSSGDAVAGGGTYKSYTRFFLPQKSTIDRVTVDGIQVPYLGESVGVGQRLPYAVIESDPRGTAVGVAGTIDPGQDRRIVVTYRIAGMNLLTSVPSLLIVSVRKQSGVPAMPYNLTLVPPSGVKSSARLGPSGSLNQRETGSHLVANDEKISYNETLKSDRAVIISFRKE